MTVGYYSGSSTGPNDLIDKFRIAALAEGWTVNLFTTVGAGYRLHIQKTASDAVTVMYFNLRSAIEEYGSTITENNDNDADGEVTGLLVNGSTGYNVANSWDKQPGYAQDIDDSNYSFAMCMTEMSQSAIPAYYFYFVGDSVHIVVETTSGKIQFLSFGMLVKQGTYTGGLYFTGTYNSNQPAREYSNSAWYHPHYFASLTAGYAHGAVYVDADSAADWRIAQGDNYPEIYFPCIHGGTTNVGYSNSAFLSFFWYMSPNYYNSIAPFAHLYVLLNRTDDNYSLLGWPEGIRFLNCQNYDNADEESYGSETWMVFESDSGAEDPTNEFVGFAFLKDDGT